AFSTLVHTEEDIIVLLLAGSQYVLVDFQIGIGLAVSGLFFYYLPFGLCKLSLDAVHRLGMGIGLAAHLGGQISDLLIGVGLVAIRGAGILGRDLHLVFEFVVGRVPIGLVDVGRDDEGSHQQTQDQIYKDENLAQIRHDRSPCRRRGLE